MNINLTAKEDIPKYSAMPPQTPLIDLSVEDFFNAFSNSIPPSVFRSKLKFNDSINRMSLSQLYFDYP